MLAAASVDTLDSAAAATFQADTLPAECAPARFTPVQVYPAVSPTALHSLSAVSRNAAGPTAPSCITISAARAFAPTEPVIAGATPAAAITIPTTADSTIPTGGGIRTLPMTRITRIISPKPTR